MYYKMGKLLGIAEFDAYIKLPETHEDEFQAGYNKAGDTTQPTWVDMPVTPFEIFEDEVIMCIDDHAKRNEVANMIIEWYALSNVYWGIANYTTFDITEVREQMAKEMMELLKYVKRYFEANFERG